MKITERLPKDLSIQRGNFFYSFALMNRSKATIEKNIRIRDIELLKKYIEE